jgi:hypothetical protein
MNDQKPCYNFLSKINNLTCALDQKGECLNSCVFRWFLKVTIFSFMVVDSLIKSIAFAQIKPTRHIADTKKNIYLSITFFIFTSCFALRKR